MTAVLVINAVLLAFCLGWVAHKQLLGVIERLSDLESRDKDEPQEPFVTYSDRAFTNENMVNQPGSAIITPKTPQLVEFEEQQALEHMNMGRPR